MTFAGTGLGEDAVDVAVLGDVVGAHRAVAARARITEISRSNETCVSRIDGASPTERHAATRSSPERISAWPLPS